MKKSRLLFLLPALGLFLSGCENPFSKKDSPSQQEQKTVSSIAVSGSYKTEYVIGEEFDKAGIVVTATYSDSSTGVVSSEASFSGFSSEVAGDVTVTVSYEGKTTSFSVSVKAIVAFPEASATLARAGISAVIPSFVCEEGESEYYGYGFYLLTGPSDEEVEAYVASLEALGWTIEGEDGYYEGSYGDRVSVSLMSYMGMVMVQFNVAYKVVEAFPAAEAKAFLAKFNVSAEIPAYTVASAEASIEVDDFTDEDYYVVYIENSTAEELAAYKDALVAGGWVVISEVDEETTDFSLQFGESDVYASLVYFGEDQVDEGESPYVGVAFYYYSVPEVVKAINAAFEPFVGEDFLELTDYGYYAGNLDASVKGQEASYVDEAPESLLKPVAEEVASVIPAAYGTPSYKYYTSEEHYWDDDDPATAAEYKFVGEGYEIYVVSYCYESALYCDVYVMVE